MSEHEHRLFEMEKSTEESSPLYTQQYEERFYPAHQKLRLERKLSLFALTLEIILAAFSVYWSARFFPDFYAGNPWVLLIFLNAGLVNALFLRPELEIATEDVYT